MTSGRRFARAVYSAAVYPAGPLPTMITFSTSIAVSRSLSTLTLLCIVPLRRTPLRPRDRRFRRPSLAAPSGHGPPQLEVGHRAGHRGQPERERPIGQHRHGGVSAGHVEGDEGA